MIRCEAKNRYQVADLGIIAGKRGTDRLLLAKFLVLRDNGVMSKRHGVWVGACLCLLLGIAPVSDVFAQASTNYRIDEATLGQGGLPNSASTNYQGSSSTGDLGVGNSASTNYQVNGGSQTTKDPSLTFSVNSAGVSFC